MTQRASDLEGEAMRYALQAEENERRIIEDLSKERDEAKAAQEEAARAHREEVAVVREELAAVVWSAGEEVARMRLEWTLARALMRGNEAKRTLLAYLRARCGRERRPHHLPPC